MGSLRHMKQAFSRLFSAVVLVLSLLSVSLVAHAMTPTLTVSATGSSDSVAITVYGDSYASVVLYYQNQGYGYGAQSQYIGTTNSSGYLSTTVSSATYNLTSGSLVYVVVNNQTSSSVAWPYVYNSYNYGTGYGSLTLSQSSASVAVGQSVDVTISGGNLPYTMYPSTPNIFQAVISGNRLHVAGLNNGSGSVNVCSSGGTGSGCAVLYITVNPVNYYGGINYNGNQISLSQNSLSLNSGASGAVTIYGTGGYYISSNTNPNIASAYINGGTVSVSAVSYGSDTISICQTGGQCALLSITVGYGSTGYNTPVQPAVTFSQNSPTLSVGQSITISISGGNTYNYGYYGGNYNIAYNSNSSGLSAIINGNVLTLQGLMNGNNAVVVCSQSANCSALNITVGATSYTNSGGWVSCSGENGFCSFSGTQNVRYGANGVYVYRVVSSGTTCSNAVFGDPIFGVAKTCSLNSGY